MSAMPNVTSEEANRFDLLELDPPSSPAAANAEGDDASARFSLLELDGPVPPDVQCDRERMTELAQAEDDEVVFGAPPTPADFGGIAAEASANAATAAGEFGSIREVTAANAVNAPIESGRDSWHPTAEFDESRGVVHAPTGQSIFERPVAERRFIVGDRQERTPEQEAAVKVVMDMRPSELVAGAAAAGNGVIIGWRGDADMTRRALLEAMRSIGREDWAPEPREPRAHAGEAIRGLTGYHVKAERKAQVIREGMQARPTGEHRWQVGKVHSMGMPGEKYGLTVLVMTLSASGELTGAGDQTLAAKVIANYRQRLDDQLYTSGNLTTWLAETLKTRCAAVDYGIGWYVPARHRDTAVALCAALARTGWGVEKKWLGSDKRPALPIATCDELRDGLVTGLKCEVAELLGKLEDERAKAREERETAIAAARAAGEDEGKVRRKGDIGEDRAQSYLISLRDTSRRVLAYGELLGDERVASARTAVLDAVAELEGLLGDAGNGITARFAGVWDEIQFDLRKERERAVGGGS
jgi:hypothetical protein